MHATFPSLSSIRFADAFSPSVGWIVTINAYYETYVKSIYDTVIEALYANPARKFISVEMAYFSMWWEEADIFQQITARLVCVNRVNDCKNSSL